MKRRFRLTRSEDIKRVRRSGKSYAHPLVVLYVTEAEPPGLRVAVTAGGAVGNAVRRNRAKRLLRSAMNALLPEIQPGCDLLLIARSRLAQSDAGQTRDALAALLARAGRLSSSHDG